LTSSRRRSAGRRDPGRSQATGMITDNLIRAGARCCRPARAWRCPQPDRDPDVYERFGPSPVHGTQVSNAYGEELVAGS
jgi:hypothetical protein